MNSVISDLINDRLTVIGRAGETGLVQSRLLLVQSEFHL